MSTAKSTARVVGTALASFALVGCGGTSGSGGSNVLPIVVSAGPAGPQNAYVNGLFGSVTVCVPGSRSQCQTIDGILIDTGSSGLRILSSVLSLSLASQTNSSGEVHDCTQFGDGSFVWGPVVSADVTIAGEQASAVPIQIIADPGSTAFAQPPSACDSGGGTNAGTLQQLGAKGLLGLSFFREDCGHQCEVDTSPGVYYACTSSGCSPTTEPLADQLPNPVWRFGGDNNGVVVALPAIPSAGATSVNGTLTFGIGTQSNNGLGRAGILAVNDNGDVTTSFAGQSYKSGFDTGSNALFFLTAASSGIPACNDDDQFYCPTATQTLSASILGRELANSWRFTAAKGSWPPSK